MPINIFKKNYHGIHTVQDVHADGESIYMDKKGFMHVGDDIQEGAQKGSSAVQPEVLNAVAEGLQDEIDLIKAKSDVVDIVGTYADLESYDITKIHENDIVKVLTDETHGNERSYYRLVAGAWVYVGSESSLPTPGEDGTAIIAVNGEWKQVEGYGYSEEGITIEWDGDTTGKEECAVYPDRYKMSDNGSPIENPNAIIEIYEEGETHEMPIGEITWIIPDKEWGSDDALIIGVVEDFEYNGNTVHKGLYFVSGGSYYDYYVSKLTVPGTVHTIDPKFIPKSENDEFVIKFSNGMDGLAGDKSVAELREAVLSRKRIRGELWNPYYTRNFICDLTFYDLGLGLFSSNNIDLDNNTLYAIIIKPGEDEESWVLEDKLYTLTPAPDVTPAT